MSAELATRNTVKVVDTASGRVLNERTVWTRVREFFSGFPPFTVSFWPVTGLRSRFGLPNMGAVTRAPNYDGTTVTYDVARQLYRNDGANSNLGAAFARPIVDLIVQYMGIPRCDSENPERDDRANDCLHIFWSSALLEVVRNSVRDSKTFVRLKKDSMLDPLATIDEIKAGRVEVIDPERVLIFERDFKNNNIVNRVVIVHRIPKLENLDGSEFDPASGMLPRMREHEVWEILTRERTEYWDRTEGAPFADPVENPYTFIPVEEWYNEYDSTLRGGQSALESSYPFMLAFHDVMRQALQAHKYHSDPKIVLKVADISNFMINNFPDAWDAASNRPVNGAKISYSGREVFIMEADEDVSFLEVRSVLGDSKVLLEFLLDCICIASETPKFAFMKAESGEGNTEMLPFEKKIERYRIGHGRHFQNLLKMYFKMQGEPPVRVNLTWSAVRVEDLAAMMQAFQLYVMGAELLQQKQLVSDETVQTGVRTFLPWMKNPQQEATDAKSNVVIDMTPAGAPAPSSSPSGNGKVTVKQGAQGKNE